jgi:ElaB/YqjD/DUF883 family membrane-anchored ribosome-binding protein
MEKRDIREKAEQWSDQAQDLSEQGQEWKEQAQEKLGELKSRAQEYQQRLSETARNTGRVIDEYVHENTWMTVAGVALLGCAIGFLLARSSRD